MAKDAKATESKMVVSEARRGSRIHSGGRCVHRRIGAGLVLERVQGRIFGGML